MEQRQREELELIARRDPSFLLMHLANTSYDAALVQRMFELAKERAAALLDPEQDSVAAERDDWKRRWQVAVDEASKLTIERNHWQANHDAQVERAKFLLDRPDMPLERTRAYRHMADLQRLVDVQRGLLDAFKGLLKLPEGGDPFKDEPPALASSEERLRAAYCVQQPLPVPDQMALVWRVDIGRLRADWIHKKAYFDAVVPEMQAIRAAIDDYHYALDTRQHGGVAQSTAFNAICQAVGKVWKQGEEKAKRDGAKKAAHEIVIEQKRTHQTVQFADRTRYVASIDPNEGVKAIPTR